MLKASNTVVLKCAKVDAGPVPGAEGRFGVGATKSDIQDAQFQIDFAVDKLIRDFNAVDDPDGKMNSHGVTARYLLKHALIQMRIGCGPEASKYAGRINSALASR